jgi:hypothetical protein
MTRAPKRPLAAPLPAGLAAAVARAGVNPTADRRTVQDALRRAIAGRGGYVDWDYDEDGWVVFLLAPEREEFRGATVQEALAWCLVWLMVGELGGGAIG